MGALITVAITLIVGGAVFSYVNGEASVQESKYGAAVAGSVDQLNERFVVANMAFSSVPCSPCSTTFYVYNNGQESLQLIQILLYNYDTTSSQISFDCTSSGCTNQSTGSCAGTGPATLLPGGTVLGSAMTPIKSHSAPTMFTIQLPPTCSWNSGSTYYLSITGLNGNNVVYYSVKS